MNHYEKLATLAIRWMAVGFFALAVVSGALALSMGAMGSMMGAGQQGMPGGMGPMMRGGAGMWWGPVLLNLVVGFLLYAVSRPVGRVMASGFGE